MNLRITVAAVATAMALFAADAWKNTDFTQWSPEDAKKVLTKSPWAKEVTVSMGQPGGYPGGGGGSRRGGGGGSGLGGAEVGGVGGGEGLGGGRGSRGGGGDEMGGDRGSAPSMKLVVRWESAMPVKAAEMKVQYGDKLPAKGEKGYTLDTPMSSYVVSVTGLRMPGGRGRRQQEGSEQQGGDGTQRSSADRMKDQLMGSGKLVRKGKDPIAPQDVLINPATNVAVFVFPRTDAISEDDKDVEFRMSLGPIQVKEKFISKICGSAGSWNCNRSPVITDGHRVN